MDKLKNYNVSFAGLSLGKHYFEYELEQKFFDLFQFEQDFTNPKLKVNLELEKKTTMLELSFSLSGTMCVHCDLTDELYDQEISAQSKLVIKFGEEFDDTDSEIWVIPIDEFQINIAQVIYEIALLSLPTKRLHPDVMKGDGNSEMLELLEKYSIQLEEEEDDGDIDPRWNKLREL